MRYVVGHEAEPGCLFCNRLAAADDVASLIVHRAPLAFLILNLFPYNTGHLMIVPNAHVASPEETDPPALAAMGELLRPSLRALRRVLGCDGFNAGFNVGEVAGAGVADHLHEHVVPRWVGDANFMPILAGTMVLPELVPVTYAKVRAEIGREVGAGDAIPIVARDAAARRVLLQPDGSLPTAVAAPDEPLWKAAVRFIQMSTGTAAEIDGWAGDERADGAQRALALVLPGTPPDPPVDQGLQWSEPDRIRPASARRAVERVRPTEGGA